MNLIYVTKREKRKSTGGPKSDTAACSADARSSPRHSVASKTGHAIAERDSIATAHLASVEKNTTMTSAAQLPQNVIGSPAALLVRA